MNKKLIFQLSLFGLAMAFATVFFIPSKTEPLFWLLIFIFCAYLIAKNCTSNYFLHGLLVSLLNSVWITAVHLALFDKYVTTHAGEAKAMSAMPLAPKVMMLLTGPVVGLISGLILGLFAFIASKMMHKKTTD